MFSAFDCWCFYDLKIIDQSDRCGNRSIHWAIMLRNLRMMMFLTPFYFQWTLRKGVKNLVWPMKKISIFKVSLDCTWCDLSLNRMHVSLLFDMWRILYLETAPYAFIYSRVHERRTFHVVFCLLYVSQDTGFKNVCERKKWF